MQAAFRWEKFKTHQEIVLSISLHDMRKEQEGQWILPEVRNTRQHEIITVTPRSSKTPEGNANT